MCPDPLPSLEPEPHLALPNKLSRGETIPNTKKKCAALIAASAALGVGTLCVCASARVSPSVMHITVVGGGNSTPIFAALAKDAGHEVATAAPRMAETRELSR